MATRSSTNSGIGYFFQGFSLAFTSGIRRFIIIPLVINLFLMGALIALLMAKLSDWISNWLAHLPSWLAWLSYLLWPLLTAAILITCSNFFSIFANWIAAPFNGLLSEHVEAKLTGRQPPGESLMHIIKALPRNLKRECQKLAYYLPRALGLLLLMWTPLIGQTLSPLLWFIFSAWMLSVQYCDYPFDNHNITFSIMKSHLHKHKRICLSFGAIVMLFTLTPIVNLIVMPVAVCGATAIWVDHFRSNFAQY